MSPGPPLVTIAVERGRRRSGLPLLVSLKVAGFCVVWSSAFSAAKLAIADCPPLLLLSIRFVVAGTVLLAAAALFGKSLRTSWRDVLVLAALGLLNNVLYLGLSFVALKTVSAGLTTIIVSANPILTTVAAALLLGERLSLRKMIGLILGLGGVAFIVHDRIGRGFDEPHGILLVAGALAALVAGTLLYKLFAPREGLWVGTGIQNIAAGAVLGPFALATESMAAIHVTPSLVLAIAHLALIVSVAGFMLWYHLLDISSATTASSYHFLMPPLGLIFSWIVLHEPVPMINLVGIVPVAVGIYLVTRERPAAP